MFRVCGIVPGCFVEYQRKDGTIEEARVLALIGSDKAILVSKNYHALIAPLKYCELKYAVVGNKVHSLSGECIRQL